MNDEKRPPDRPNPSIGAVTAHALDANTKRGDPVDKPSIAELQRLLSGEPDPERDCAACHTHMHVPPDLEPSALCNRCAQRFVVVAPVLLEIAKAALELTGPSQPGEAHIPAWNALLAATAKVRP